MEILGLYDNKKKRLNKSIVRGNTPENGEHILVSVAFIKNKDGKYLIQKTSLEKGGLYSSTGGHVLESENSKETIIREIKEELGIMVAEDEVKYVGDIMLGVAFADIYYLEKDIDINSVLLQKEEVESISYMTEDEIYNLIIEDKMLKSHGLMFMNYFLKEGGI